jgi:hypothetical protein
MFFNLFSLQCVYMRIKLFAFLKQEMKDQAK